MTGSRLNPLRRASARACRTVLVRSIQTTSVRGTITSRAIVSPSSNTEWIMFRSPDSHDAALLGHVDELAQLDLGGERPVAEAAAGGDRVADQDQQGRHRAEDAAEQPDDAGGGERRAVGVLAAERARPTPTST